MAPKPDFSGYVTKFGIKCTDGRTILAHAFQAMDGQQVPLVWQHQHNSAENVLGHVVLSHRADGVWGDGFFNDTPNGQHAKSLVEHKDVNALSIYANQLVEKARQVMHGVIREVSLVLSGANPGAFIESINIAHSSDGEELLTEAVIYTSGEQDLAELAHAGSTTVAPPKKVSSKGPMPPASGDKKPATQKPTAANPDPDGDGDNDLFDPADGGLGPDASVQDVLDTMTPEQQKVVYGLIGAAMQQSSDDGDDPDNTVSHQQKGQGSVTRNVFDQSTAAGQAQGATLSHSDMQGIFESARKGGSLKAAVEEYAFAHGIDDISTLFPYDQAVSDTPDFISRRTEWVNGVLSTTHKTPFSRIRSWTADLTFQEARAKGFVKGNLKKEEFIRIARRITTPQTVYKKQKLDRDDILDITEFNVVTWLQTEMRLMLDEELARAILIGDGRDADDPDKIDTSNVRPIYGDDDMYCTQVSVASSAITSSADAIVDSVVQSMRFYRGSGNPVFYTTRVWLAKLLLIKDTLGRRIYPTTDELQAAMGVSGIVPCEALEAEPDLIGLVVNLADYTTGTDKGGEVSMFDFFDIDYNQFKYLMETRMSGALTKYRAALAVVQFTGAGGLLSDPVEPTFDSTTGIGTIPDATGLHYSYVTVADDGTLSGALTAGAQTAIGTGAYVTYRAVPASTYEFSTDNFEWTFRRDS